ncbi:hypothetical protein ACM61V_04355 [Sphingomonas sp. TX0543]|uniref:hypothetical protein n=1 Tax=Sphingomonas sp. TX0543 TaxID=3399682 RepID=UPI003AFB6B60
MIEHDANTHIETHHRFGDPGARARSAATLANEVSELLSGPAAAELGPLHPGPLDHDGHPSNWPALRSDPAPGFGGAQLHHNLGSGDMGVLNPHIVAREVQDVLDGIELHRRAATAAVDAARKRALEAIGECDDTFSPSRLTAMTFSTGGPGDVRVGLDVEILGHDLTRRVLPLRRMVGSKEHSGLTTALTVHERRVASLARLRANGWAGWIDETARLVLAEAGVETGTAIRQLLPLNQFAIRFGNGRWTATLMWKEGVITADIHDRSTNLGLYDGELQFGAGLPDTLFDSLPGRRLGDVAVVQHPFLSPEAVITDSYERGGVRFARIVVPTTPLPDQARSPETGKGGGSED